MKGFDVKNESNVPLRNIAEGLRDGTPIALGYFAVAFSLGIIAKKAGLTAPLGFFSSFFTRASAGEYGVYTLVAIHATYVELIAMCLVTNLRYMLMSAALSQKLAPATSWLHRLLMACCITDEIFGISVNHEGYTPPAYTYSAALISSLFWASGCGRWYAAHPHRFSPQCGSLWHVPCHHRAPSTCRPQCALCPHCQLSPEWHLRCRSCCQSMEQWHTHHPAHHSYFICRGMASTYQKTRIKWNRIAPFFISYWRFWSRT